MSAFANRNPSAHGASLRRYAGSKITRQDLQMTRPSLLALLLLITSAPTAVVAQAYKCVVGGSIVYQQNPCQGGTKLDIPPPPDPNTREGRMAIAIAKKQIVIGMTAAEVVQSWGKPDKINSSATRENRNEQWVFSSDRPIGRAQYVYLENGIVRSWQSSD